MEWMISRHSAKAKRLTARQAPHGIIVSGSIEDCTVLYVFMLHRE
jgi:hypothetical protein